jgi:hypothetical protein
MPPMLDQHGIGSARLRLMPCRKGRFFPQKIVKDIRGKF